MLLNNIKEKMEKHIMELKLLKAEQKYTFIVHIGMKERKILL